MLCLHHLTTSDLAPDVGPEIVQVPDDDIIETTEMRITTTAAFTPTLPN